MWRSVMLRGRELELAACWAAIDDRALVGSVVVITGEPGIGKTALLAELGSRAASAGVHTVVVRGREHDVARPLSPWSAALAAAIEQPDDVVDAVDELSTRTR